MSIYFQQVKLTKDKRSRFKLVLFFCMCVVGSAILRKGLWVLISCILNAELNTSQGMSNSAY